MRIVYADVVLVINFCVDYLILYTTCFFFHLKVKFVRLLFAAAFGSFVALFTVIFLSYFPFFRMVSAMISLVIMCNIAFGRRSRIMMLKLCTVVMLMSIILGGVVLLIGINSKFDGALKLLAGCVLFLVVHRFLNVVLKTQVTKKFLNVDILLCGKMLSLYLLVDSGNLLVDPYTSLPVIVLSSKNFSDETLCLKPRLVPFKTVSGNGMLEVVTPDCVFIKGEKQKYSVDAVVGFSDVVEGCDGILPYQLSIER